MRNHANNRVGFMRVHQGDCIRLLSDKDIYQVIAIDDHHDRCWVRRWPLQRHGSPVFEVSLSSVESPGQPMPAA
ncbi:hypothetical protein [Synechococcus sp. Minos11]|uniref:hypothetical protein n=1 Tax=Synechococcus sp. Minos11 TaxID=221341 RepID=UPI00351C8EAA